MHIHYACVHLSIRYLTAKFCANKNKQNQIKSPVSHGNQEIFSYHYFLKTYGKSISKGRNSCNKYRYSCYLRKVNSHLAIKPSSCLRVTSCKILQKQNLTLELNTQEKSYISDYPASLISSLLCFPQLALIPSPSIILGQIVVRESLFATFHSQSAISDFP